jgi:hypothetical protein
MDAVLGLSRDLVMWHPEPPPAALVAWAGQDLAWWRRAVGEPGPERWPGWEQPPLYAAADAPTLALRAAADPGRVPADVETVGDLLWYAELGDALARLEGYPAAAVEPAPMLPWVMTDPPPPERPLVPQAASVELAAAGAAQLVDLGGAVPRRCRTWTGLVDGLLAGATVAAALTGDFTVPAPVAERDGTALPGTDVRIEVARSRRRLAEWSDYMGNCIATPPYADPAAAGEVALLALRGPDGRVRVNVEVRPTSRGWRLGEVRARFNEDPDPDLLRAAREWVARLPVPTPSAAVEPPDDVVPGPGPVRPRRPSSARADLAPALADAVEPAAVAAVGVLACLAGRPGSPAGGAVPRDAADALVALRRVTPDGLARACRLALADPTAPGVAELWAASGVRPLTLAVRALPADDGRRLAALLVDAPLPGALRPLARSPRIAPARTAELVALRVRAALGSLLRADAPELAAAVRARPVRPVLRAAALAVTSWGGLPAGSPVAVVNPRRRVRLVDLPPASLRDADWQSAWPDAVELGAHRDGFAPHLAAHGLLLPESWLSRGGLPALWSRALPEA